MSANGAVLGVRWTYVAVIVAVLLTITGGPALAAWHASSDAAAGTAHADALPPGRSPQPIRLGRNVDVTWSQVDLRGRPLGMYAGGGYRVERDGTSAAGSCSGLVTPGDLAVSTCRESGLAPGTYDFRVTPHLAGWSGAPSPGTTITVPGPSLTFSPTTWSGAGTPLIGTVDGFLDGAPLTYRLDDPVRGAVLAGSLTRFPTAPAAASSTAVPVGCGPATGNQHHVYVMSSRDAEQSAGAFTFDFSTILCPSMITSTAGSQPGRAQPADTLGVAFSRAVDPVTVCSTLRVGQTTAPGLRATIVDGGTANDRLVVSAPVPATSSKEACGSSAPLCVLVCLGGSAGTVTLGTFDLGSPAYALDGNVTFVDSTLGLDPTGTTLTLTLGPGSGTTGTAATTAVATYTPDTTIRSATGALPAVGHMTSGAALW